MGRKKSVMERALWERFRDLVEAGKQQYGLTISSMCDVPAKQLTPLDLVGERIGIQRKAHNRLLSAGYTTKAKLHKMIENALARPGADWKAHAILMMMCNCRKTREWRLAHQNESDPWWPQFLEFLRSLPPYVGFEEAAPIQGKPTAFVHPGSAAAFADELADALVKHRLIKKIDRDAAADVMTEHMRREATGYAGAFTDWIRSSKSFQRVTVREGYRREREGVNVHVKVLVVEPRSMLEEPRELHDGEREADYHEYIQAVMLYAIENLRGGDTRRPMSFEQVLLPASNFEMAD